MFLVTVPRRWSTQPPGLVPLAARAGAKVIEINLEPTPFSDTVHCSLRGLAGELLPKLLSGV